MRGFYVMMAVLLGGFGFAGAGGAVAAAEPIVVAEQGDSAYRIFLAEAAPASVELAAEELQHYIAEATGAKLPIVAGAQPPESPFISLGDNSASRAAGLDPAQLPVESYRILTRDGNLYILGPDTPDGEHTDKGGTSTGTLNGVYTFLEDYLGIRWLMPGSVGEDVPHTQRLALPAIDRTDAPGFFNRRIPYIQPREPEVRTWLRRNKQGYSLRLNHAHNWKRTIGPELFEQHPDWFAMIDGKRVRPGGRYKLETTNPELVEAYAKRAIEALTDNPARYTYSLSPSDSRGWSESPQSKALYDPPPEGSRFPSVTPLIVKFYRDVAEQVAQADPDMAVAGYIYADYLHPPQAGIPALPDNLYLVIAPNFDYGFTLYRPEIRERFEQVFSAWAEATDKIAYYDLPNWLRQSIGAPTPPALDILGFIYPRLVKYGVKGVYIYGKAAWGTGAVSNYVMAKLNWDPQADPHALAAEFYRRAYGPDAGASMQQLYQTLDKAFKKFFLQHDDARYTLTPAMMKTVYADHYPELESLYLEAKAAADKPKQEARLAMFGKNLALLQWNLRKRGMIEADESSPLYRTDEQINAMIAQAGEDLALSPKVAAAEPTQTVDAVRVTVPDGPIEGAGEPEPFWLRGPARILLYPLADEDIAITAAELRARGELVRYQVVDSLGQSVTRGVLTEGQTFRFPAHERQVYFLDINCRSASYDLRIDGSRFAIKTKGEGRHKALHLLNKLTPVYFHVPEQIGKFTVTLRSPSPGETAAADVVTPAGEVVASLDTSSLPVVRAELDAAGVPSGFWTLRFKPPTSGSVDDVYIKLDPALSPWVVTDPARPIIVRPAQ